MRRILAAAAVAALTLGVASCGDDDTSTSSDTSDSPASDATTGPDDADATDAPGAADATDTPDDADDTETTASDDIESDDEDESSGELTEDCQALRERFEDQFTENADFGDIADAIDDVKAITPDDVDDDLEVLEGVYDRMADLLEERGGDLAEALTDPEVLKELESMNSPEVQEATANVTAYFDERCPGIGD